MSDRPLSELAREITEGAVRLSAATAAWLVLVAEFDERGGWGGPGIRSCAHWLSWQCGLSMGAAREHVRVARALRRLPLTTSAFLEGRISYVKARALTRVAEPATEATLLDFAATAVLGRAEREARRERAEATRVAARCDLTSVDRDIARRYEEPEGRLAAQQSTARRCAALASLARDAAHVGRRAGDPPRREVVVHVDAGVLADDAAAGQAFVEGGPALAAADVRRMLCEATVVTMLEKGREPLALGRRRRKASRAQRRALLRRDGGCARPGCPENRPERLHAHHMRHWLFGGRTDLTNLVLLCDADHGLVHDLDLVMTRRDGEPIVLDPDGRRVWGRADATFEDGLDGLAPELPDGGDRFVGIQPFDEIAGRRPAEVAAGERGSCAVGSIPLGSRRRRGPDGAGRAAALGCRDVSTLLFPDGEPPDLPDTLEAGGERMSLAWAVSVLMGNRDVARRMAAELGSAA